MSSYRLPDGVEFLGDAGTVAATKSRGRGPPTVGTPDPGRDNDDGVLLSHSGISLAEQCRRVLPPDIALEHSPERFTDEVQRFDPGHAGCDAWAAWVETRDYGGAKDFRVCDRSARLASEWMEHHYNIPASIYTVGC